MANSRNSVHDDRQISVKQWRTNWYCRGVYFNLFRELDDAAWAIAKLYPQKPKELFDDLVTLHGPQTTSHISRRRPNSTHLNKTVSDSRQSFSKTADDWPEMLTGLLAAGLLLAARLDSTRRSRSAGRVGSELAQRWWNKNAFSRWLKLLGHQPDGSHVMSPIPFQSIRAAIANDALQPMAMQLATSAESTDLECNDGMLCASESTQIADS